jgi:hypothetical protein
VQVWKNCSIDTLYYTDRPADVDEKGSIVRLTDDYLEVAYDDGGPVVYRGKNNHDGHFNLIAPEVKGKASLHFFPNSNIMEGYWIEDGVQGMWRVRLGYLTECTSGV